MGSIRLSDATDALFIDFRFNGKRCREYTALADTPTNRKKLEKVLSRIESEIEAGTFKYEVYFPNSKALKRLPSPVPAEVVQPVPVVAQPAPAAAAAVAPTPLFKAFVDTWMQERSIEWRRSHIRSLLSTLNGRLIPHFGSKHVGQITKSDILRYRASLAEGPGRGDKPLSAKRINEIIGVLCQILAEAAEQFDFTSPGANVKRLRVRRTDVDPFSLTEVQSILATVRADYKNYFVVRFFTGMRTGEIHGLKWKYVDFERRLLLVRETFVLGEDDYTKTDGSQRDIQMSQPVFEALREQHKATGKLSEYVFCNQQAQPLDNKNFSDRVWYPLLRYLGLAERRPYQMRHTAATLWLASGEAPEWIARQLGHTNTEMLFRVYSRYVPNLTRQDGSAMERLLASRLSQGTLIEAEQGAPTNVYLPGKARAPQPVPKLRGIRGGTVSAPAPQADDDGQSWSIGEASRAQPPPAWLRLGLPAVNPHRFTPRPH